MPECSVPDTRSVAVVVSYGYQVCCCCALSRIPGLLPPCSVSDSRFASPARSVFYAGYKAIPWGARPRIPGLLLLCSVTDNRSVAVLFSSRYQVCCCCIQFRIPGLLLLYSVPDTRSVTVVFSSGYQVCCCCVQFRIPGFLRFFIFAGYQVIPWGALSRIPGLLLFCSDTETRFARGEFFCSAQILGLKLRASQANKLNRISWFLTPQSS